MVGVGNGVAVAVGGTAVAVAVAVAVFVGMMGAGVCVGGTGVAPEFGAVHATISIPIIIMTPQVFFIEHTPVSQNRHQNVSDAVKCTISDIIFATFFRQLAHTFSVGKLTDCCAITLFAPLTSFRGWHSPAK